MKDEIKEIREYISCPQFGDDHYGKWGALTIDQRRKIKYLLDYITNLQEKLNLAENILYDYLYMDKKITKELYDKFKGSDKE